MIGGAFGSPDLAGQLVAGCERAAEGVGIARLARTERRLAHVLEVGGFDAEGAASKGELSVMAESVDLSVFVQASALVCSQRLSWGDLRAAWERGPQWVPWLVAGVVAGADPLVIASAKAPNETEVELTPVFLASCPEERGPNALTRAGGVTAMPTDGLARVAKRRVPSTARLDEQDAKRAIAERLELQPAYLGCRSGALTSDLEVVVPDGAPVPTAAGWTLETRIVGPTIEDLLLGGGLGSHHLVAIRSLGSSLLARGVEWGDLSPRNIIVMDVPGDRLVLGLVDFEKVRLADRSLDVDDCFHFVRSGTAIEEFGPLCTGHEMEQLFGTGWLDGVRAHRPRRELAHLLDHCGISDADPAAVDEADRLIWHVRRPLTTSGGRVLPGAINIRLQHYAACFGLGDRSYELEHLLTAGFVHCLGVGLFDAAVQVAADVVGHLEDLAVEAEIDQRWALVTQARVPPARPSSDVLAVARWIEGLAEASTRSEAEQALALAPSADGGAHVW